MNNSTDDKPIEEAITIVIDTMQKYGIDAAIQIKHHFSFKDLEFIRMHGNLTYNGSSDSFDFYVHAPLPSSHRTSNDWAWKIAWYFSGGAFQVLKDRSIDLAQSYSKKSIEFVNELIRAPNYRN